MAESRWTYARGWLVAGVVANLVAVSLGFATEGIREPGWLGAAQGLLVATALTCLGVFAVKVLRWQAEDWTAGR